MSPAELGEAIPLAIAYSAGFTDDLAGYRAAIIENNLAEALAEIIAGIWSDGGSALVFGDTLVLDGAGRVAWERIASETPTSYTFGDPRGPEGRAYALRGETLALIAFACRVPGGPSAPPSLAPREAPARIVT